MISSLSYSNLLFYQLLMNPISNLSRTFAILMLALGLFCAPVQAQAVRDFNTNAITAMKAGKWAEAQAILKEATDLYDARALTLFGPRFGSFWYNKGYCELMLGQYAEAMKSFERCYKGYPNGKGGKNQSMNMFHKKSLLYWGHAAKGAEQWETAIQSYKKFLAERDPTRDKFQPGVFYTNLAICYFKLQNIPEGSKNLETAIVNKVKFPTSNKNILLSFNALVQAVVAKKDEKALLDFINKNRGHIALDPFEAYEFAPLFMKLAHDAKNAGMLRASSELYSLVPSTISAIDDVEARLKMVGDYPRLIRDGSKLVKKANLEKDLESLKEAQRSGQINEVYALLNTAVMHEDAGNIRGAFAVYEQMELYYPTAKIFVDGKIVPAREKNLYNLVRTSSLIGEVLTTEEYGSRFLKAFPTSEYTGEVRRLTLSSLFWEGEYAKVIEVATPMLNKLEANKPSEQHDICLFVLGGSQHYSGNFDVAQPLLDEHVSSYSETKAHRRQAALYFQASNLFRLQYWTRSAALLDAFLKKYPETGANPYLPFALFDRANCHFAEEEYAEALEKVTRVETEFPSFGAMESIFALKGNILENNDRPEEAIAYYEKSLALAEKKKTDIVAGEVLLYLVNILGAETVGNEPNPDIQRAIPYYDRFWKSYAESPYRAQVAVTGLPAMRSAGRTKESLEILQGVIADLSKMPGTPGLEEAINSYTEAYLAENTPEELKDHYYNFKGIDSNDAASRALLRIAIIGVFEDKLETSEKAKDDAGVSQAQATIKVLFNELKSDFDAKDLSDYILVRIGDFLREKTSSPEQAVSYYKDALASPDKAYEFPALFGLADVLGTGSDADKKEAIKVLDRVYADAEKKDQKEKALFRIVTIEFETGNYQEAIDRGRAYLSDKKIQQRNGPMARLIIGQSYDKLGQSEDAIAIYGQIWATSPGFVKVSAPSLKRWMELLWERNASNRDDGVSDRQKVYEAGWKWVDNTKAPSFLNKLTEEEKANRDAIAALVAEYEAYPEIKSMAAMQAEKEAGN